MLVSLFKARIPPAPFLADNHLTVLFNVTSGRIMARVQNESGKFTACYGILSKCEWLGNRDPVLWPLRYCIFVGHVFADRFRFRRSHEKGTSGNHDHLWAVGTILD